MLLSFIFDWISDYVNTPEMYLTLSQRVLFALALVIIGAVVLTITAIVYAIGVKILDKKGR